MTLNVTAAPAAAVVPDFWTYFVQQFVLDVSTDLAPDLQNILGVVATNGIVGLLDPANAALVVSYQAKLQADALKVGQDLSKQVASWLQLWIAAKFNLAAPASVAPVVRLKLAA